MVAFSLDDEQGFFKVPLNPHKSPIGDLQVTHRRPQDFFVLIFEQEFEAKCLKKMLVDRYCRLATK